MILVIDNYDSFTYNLVHLLYSLNADVVVRRNREITVAEALDMRADGLLFSPGPGRPADAGIMEELIRLARGVGRCRGVWDIRQLARLAKKCRRR